MGTYVCGLPTVCLGCVHARPKKTAAPVFRRMIASHTRALAKARNHGEPAGQLAARELELDRLRSALRRAEELDSYRLNDRDLGRTPAAATTEE
ncbi:hypothetical protein PJK45_24520 [Mycobacterium kansasii]|uniref:Uncharacterized protein n=3 Tax=Mycobacterium kansasii TaxID=1768 RepID=A0A653EMP7_MYCKA|nr:hypothetical protein [Mycobacterium kansasii]ARG91872.1 hypothetical protein B1T50_07660 [Mycobacterium kansasii]KZS76793.1 hypothetical protein A4G30_07150 [Mycobacterium kansasii]MXO38431.1 hypothetical protein [Mycobacterium kansasii]ORC10656.1 hypothetical protein B1T46_07350 [Mycobacterium kansasii]POX97144.1 hypothetical protein C3477_25190 [Mycobacterium kansasii]